MIVQAQRRLFSKPCAPVAPVAASWAPLDCCVSPARPCEALVLNMMCKDLSEGAERLSDLADFTPDGAQPSRRAHASALFVDLLSRRDATFRARCAAEPAALRLMGGLSKIPHPQDASFETHLGEMPSTCVVLEGVEDEVLCSSLPASAQLPVAFPVAAPVAPWPHPRRNPCSSG